MELTPSIYDGTLRSRKVRERQTEIRLLLLNQNTDFGSHLVNLKCGLRLRH